MSEGIASLSSPAAPSRRAQGRAVQRQARMTPHTRWRPPGVPRSRGQPPLRRGQHRNRTRCILRDLRGTVLAWCPGNSKSSARYVGVRCVWCRALCGAHTSVSPSRAHTHTPSKTILSTDRSISSSRTGSLAARPLARPLLARRHATAGPTPVAPTLPARRVSCPIRAAAGAVDRPRDACRQHHAWVAPNDWFVYGHLHFILSLPTLAIPHSRRHFSARTGAFTIRRPTPSSPSLSALALLSPSFGTHTVRRMAFGSSTLPNARYAPTSPAAEEVLWLFHHVLKTALYQLKALSSSRRIHPAAPPMLRPDLGRPCCSFSLWLVGTGHQPRRLREVHWPRRRSLLLLAHHMAGGVPVCPSPRRSPTWGWFAPGITTVLIDCLGQQSVWRSQTPSSAESASVT